MGNKNVIEVYADFIYYIPIGNKEAIDHIKSVLSEENVETYVEYLSLRALLPLASHKEILEQNRLCDIKMDNIVEEAQAHAYGSCENRDSYMLMCLKFIDNEYILTPPRYIMTDGDDPEGALSKEFSRLSRHKLDTLLINTVKPIAIIGINKDAILYVSKLHGKIKLLK